MVDSLGDQVDTSGLRVVSAGKEAEVSVPQSTTHPTPWSGQIAAMQASCTLGPPARLAREQPPRWRGVGSSHRRGRDGLLAQQRVSSTWGPQRTRMAGRRRVGWSPRPGTRAHGHRTPRVRLLTRAFTASDAAAWWGLSAGMRARADSCPGRSRVTRLDRVGSAPSPVQPTSPVDLGKANDGVGLGWSRRANSRCNASSRMTRIATPSISARDFNSPNSASGRSTVVFIWVTISGHPSTQQARLVHQLPTEHGVRARATPGDPEETSDTETARLPLISGGPKAAFKG